MYKIRFINPLIQFGLIEFHVVISDDENKFQPVRFIKEFPDDVTRQEIKEMTNRALNLLLSELELPPLEEEVEPEINLPEGKELGE